MSYKTFVVNKAGFCTRCGKYQTAHWRFPFDTCFGWTWRQRMAYAWKMFMKRVRS